MRWRAGPRGLALVTLAALTLSACVSTYRPDYHPESSYSSVQNVTYAQNAWVIPPRQDRPTRYAQTARGLDDGGAGEVTGEVTTPGGVIVYGDLYGNVYVGR